MSSKYGNDKWLIVTPIEPQLSISTSLSYNEVTRHNTLNARLPFYALQLNNSARLPMHIFSPLVLPTQLIFLFS